MLSLEGEPQQSSGGSGMLAGPMEALESVLSGVPFLGEPPP